MNISYDPTNAKERATVDLINAAVADAQARERRAAQLKKSTTSPDARGVREARFALFWSVVHHKVKRAKAETAFHKAVDRVAERGEMSKGEATEFICAKMAAYAKSPAGKPTDRTPTHPATWLNGDQFEDDPAAWEAENGHPPQPQDEGDLF